MTTLTLTVLLESYDFDEAPTAEIVLTHEQRSKKRLKAQLQDGRDAAIMLPRQAVIHPGNVLSNDGGDLVLVVAALENVSIVRLPNALDFARVSYHLGNRHVALQISDGEVSYLHDHVLDDMVTGMGFEVTSDHREFIPESGAYHGHHHSH